MDHHAYLNFIFLTSWNQKYESMNHYCKPDMKEGHWNESNPLCAKKVVIGKFHKYIW